MDANEFSRDDESTYNYPPILTVPVLTVFFVLERLP